MDAWVAYVAGASKGAPRAVEPTADTPHEYTLEAAYPNPFNPQATITFSLPETAAVTLAVYDLLGRPVRVLAKDTLQAGRHEVVFDAGDLPGGLYLYRLQTPAVSHTRSMALVR